MLRFVQAKDPTVASSRLDDPTVVDPLVDKDDARDASNVHDQPSFHASRYISAQSMYLLRRFR